MRKYRLFYKFAEREVYMELNMMSIGERIKKRRLDLRLTQTDIFEQCGIASGTLSRIENGINVPSIIIFHKLAQTLKCDMDWLATGKSSNTQISSLCESEENLLNGFRQLPEDEQIELLEILEMKLRKLHKTRNHSAQSSQSTATERNDIAG